MQIDQMKGYLQVLVLLLLINCKMIIKARVIVVSHSGVICHCFQPFVKSSAFELGVLRETQFHLLG